MNENELSHWRLSKGEKAKNHKYIARIEDGDSYRYFYSLSEYNNYLNNGKTATQQPLIPNKIIGAQQYNQRPQTTVNKTAPVQKQSRLSLFLSKVKSTVINGSKFIDKNIIKAGGKKVSEFQKI